MPTMKDALDAFCFHNKRHSEMTQIWYAKRLHQFMTWCKAHKLELEHITVKQVSQYLEELVSRNNLAKGKSGPLSSYTVHGHARVIRRFFNWLAVEEEFEGVVDPRIGKKIPMPKIKVKVIEVFTRDECKQLFEACNDDFTWPMIVARNKAILSMLLDTGIRASELCGLTLDHCYLNQGDSYIRVMGKGSKEREVGLGKKSLVALQDYIQHFRKAPHTEQRVFIGLGGQPLNPHGLHRMLYRLGKRAGIEDTHPHKFRHTWAVMYLLNGGDVYMLSTLLGHVSVSVTEIYVQTVKSMQARKLSKSVFDQL